MDHLNRSLLILRYIHDKIGRDFRQSYWEAVSSIFPVKDTFLVFGRRFHNTKNPCPSHFCERQRPSAAMISIWSGEMKQLSYSTGSVSLSRFFTTPGVSVSIDPYSIRHRTTSLTYTFPLWPTYFTTCWISSFSPFGADSSKRSYQRSESNFRRKSYQLNFLTITRAEIFEY